MSTVKRIAWKMRWPLLAAVGFPLLLTACSTGRFDYYDTGSDYVILKQGQVFTAPRDMTLATESIVQKKDQQILDLVKVNRELIRQLQFQKGE